jgi:hypothetical protein
MRWCVPGRGWSDRAEIGLEIPMEVRGGWRDSACEERSGD